MNYFKENVEWVKSFFSETYEAGGLSGKASSRRIMELAVNWTFIFSYVKVTVAHQEFVPLDINWAIMLAAILGLKSLDIYAQKYISKNVPNGSNDSTESDNQQKPK